MTDDCPWEYARRPRGFTTRRAFLEYLRAEAVKAEAFELLKGIDQMLRELDASYPAAEHREPAEPAEEE